MKRKTYLDKPSKTLAVTRDTPESLEGTDIAHRAIDVANAAITGIGANEAWSFSNKPEEARFQLAQYKAAIAALNAANGMIKTKVSIFKLVDLSAKAEKLRKRGKKL